LELVARSDSDRLHIFSGDTTGEFKKKFANSMAPKDMEQSQRGVMRPGDKVYVDVTIHPGTFILAGLHRVKTALKTPESDEVADELLILCLLWPFNFKYTTREVKRWLQLTFMKRGKVDYSTRSLAPPANPADAIPVVMCTWNRIDKLSDTIQMLKNQTTNVDFHIWNNNYNARKKIDEVVKLEDRLPITAHHSSFNIGGFGRFYAAKQLNDRHKKVIFIDDDQKLGANAVKLLANDFKQNSVISQWAFKFINDNYWDKKPVDPGEAADYCGTGGMVVDLSIFESKEVFSCPKRFWFVEDLWLSHIAKQKGWSLNKSSKEIVIIEDNKDQMYGLIDKKDAMLKKLSKHS